ATLEPRGVSGELLVVFKPSGTLPLGEIADLLHASLTAVRDKQKRERRIERLEAIISIAAEWRQTLVMDELLTKMAEASTRLLNAERASIFLWDRTKKELVGRPALGVDNNELRIP